MINEAYNETKFKSMSKNKFKKFVKLKIHNIKNTNCKTIWNQIYSQISKLKSFFRLRSQNIEVKANFKSKYKVNNVINLQCRMDNCYEIEDQ